MRSTLKIDHYQEKQDDKPDKQRYEHECVPCVAQDENISEQEVKNELRTRPWCRTRGAAYKAAFNEARQEFPGMSHRGARNIARLSMPPAEVLDIHPPS